jgi:hypothetical protein
VSLIAIIATIIGIFVVIPLLASFLMAVILEAANHEGIYDDLESDS